jgi:hypothetical protein
METKIGQRTSGRADFWFAPRVVVSQYADHLPLHRQEAIPVRHGVKLSRVRETQFRKSRLVPLDPSAAGALLPYAEVRDRIVRHPRDGCVFLVTRDAALTYSKTRTAFRGLRIRHG